MWRSKVGLRSCRGKVREQHREPPAETSVAEALGSSVLCRTDSRIRGATAGLVGNGNGERGALLRLDQPSGNSPQALRPLK